VAILTLLHTNDLHARLDQMARLATLVQRERAQAARDGRAVLLLDARDSSGTSSWESDVTGGRANYAMLEAMGYDAAAIGNSDSQWGRESLARLLESLHFVALAANLRETASGLPPAGLRTHAVFRPGALAVGVAGLATPEGTHPDFQVLDPVETLRGLRPTLQEDGAHVLIVLSHLGIEADRQLALAVPGLHAILGGHSHTTLVRPEFVGQTAIVQTGEYGSFLGRLDLGLDPDCGQVTVSDYSLLACTATTPPDPTLSGMLELIRFEAGVLKKKRGS
jgi:2',3'-cyclic-nucleotide 2'-phosphodiesterase (5'-nucleotidase family)